MLILVHGSRGLDYLLNEYVAPGHYYVSTICTSPSGGINIELNPRVSIDLALIWSRVLGLRPGASRVLLDALLGFGRLRDAVDHVLDVYVDHEAHELYFYLKSLRSLDIWEPIGEGSCIASTGLEPLRTLVAAVVGVHVMHLANLPKAPVILSTDSVDTLVDFLHSMRRLGKVIVHTNTRPRNMGIFDEAIITAEWVPRHGMGELIRVFGGRVDKLITKEAPRGTLEAGARAMGLGKLVIDVAKTVGEMGLVSLNTLVETTAQYNGVSRQEAVDAVVKAVAADLVRLRHLPDGRIVVVPTMACLRMVGSGD